MSFSLPASSLVRPTRPDSLATTYTYTYTNANQLSTITAPSECIHAPSSPICKSSNSRTLICENLRRLRTHTRHTNITLRLSVFARA